MKKLIFALATLALVAEPASAVPMRPVQDTTVAPQIEKVVYVGTRGSARRTVRRAARRRGY